MCLDLVYDRRRAGLRPAATSCSRSSPACRRTTAVKEDRSGWPVNDRLKHRIIDGDRDGLDRDLDEALAAGTPALSIVNDVLLDGMKVVGDLFGSGEMQLPFVLQSAETMKAAVAHLEPYMERSGDSTSKGRIVLATVKGDVHDIGKNLVDIILTNNGYEVYNLGIKVPDRRHGREGRGGQGRRDRHERAAREVDAHHARQPGGAERQRAVALPRAARRRRPDPRRTSSATSARSTTAGSSTGEDAFEGLRTMDAPHGAEAQPARRIPTSGECPPDGCCQRSGAPGTTRHPRSSRRVATGRHRQRALHAAVPRARVVKGISLDDIAAYVNETALFRNQWQFRPESGESDDDFKARIRPMLRMQLAEAKTSGVLCRRSSTATSPSTATATT